jgi:hypothetical protein
VILFPARDKNSNSWLINQGKKPGPVSLLPERSSNRREELKLHLGESNWIPFLERLRDLRDEHEERKDQSEKDEEKVFCERSMVVSEGVHLE